MFNINSTTWKLPYSLLFALTLVILIIEKHIRSFFLLVSIVIFLHDLRKSLYWFFWLSLIGVFQLFHFFFHLFHFLFALLTSIFLIQNIASEFIQSDYTVSSYTIICITFIQVSWRNVNSLFISTFVLCTDNASMLSSCHKRTPKMSVFSHRAVHLVLWIDSQVLLISLSSVIYLDCNIKIGLESNLLSRQ